MSGDERHGSQSEREVCSRDGMTDAMPQVASHLVFFPNSCLVSISVFDSRGRAMECVIVCVSNRSGWANWVVD